MKRSIALVTFAASLVACGSSPAPPVAPVVADVPPASSPPSPTAAPPPTPSPSSSTQVSDAQAAELARQAEQMQLAVLGSSSTGSVASATPRDAIPPVDLSGASASSPKPTGPKGDVHLGGVTATVPLTNGDRVVAGLRPRVRQCYQQGLNSDPSMSGKIVLTVKVGPNGEVHSAVAASNSGMSPAVAACVQRVYRMAQFESPGGSGSTLNVPMTFVVTK